MKLSSKRALLLANHGDEILNLMCEDATPQQWSDWLRAPLEYAAARGNGDLVTTLLKLGANGSSVGPKGCRGRTLLDAAVEGGNADVVCALLRAGSGPDINVDEAKRSPLHATIFGGNIAAARALVAAGADVNHLDREGHYTPLHAAVSEGYEEIVPHLLIAGADPNAPAGSRWEGTALHMAVERGNKNVVSALLCNPNTDKNSLDFYHQSPLMLACRVGDASIVEVFLAAGADVHFREAPVGTSALEVAAEFGRSDIIMTILERIPDVDCHVDAEGFTPLHTAACSNQAGSVDVLLDHGFAVDVKDSTLQTPLHIAAREASHDALLALMRRGAGLNTRSVNGHTALHHACIRKGTGVETTVDLLLRWGASEALVNRSGRSPADLLCDEAHPAEGERCSDEELERARALLARAPADRVWRRRCWLVMLRARAETTGTSYVADDSSSKEESGRSTKLKVEGAGDGDGGGVVCGGRRDDGEMAAVTGSFSDVVGALIGLRPQGVFRVVVGFL